MKKADLTNIALTELEQIEGLVHSVDQKIHQLTVNAQHTWETNFAGKDPSDSCVSIHVHQDSLMKLEDVGGIDFLKSAKQSQKTGKTPAVFGFVH